VELYVGDPILDMRVVSPDDTYIDFVVDPVLMASPLGMERLKWTLTSIVGASLLWEGSDGWDLRLAPEGSWRETGWNADSMNRAIKAYVQGGCWVHTVRLSSTRDMVVNVVIDPKTPVPGPYARRFADHHMVMLEALGREFGVFTAEIAREKVYDELLMRLFVPEIGMSITLEQFSSAIRHLMTSELVLADGS
jgi:hypothetical protein